MINRHTKFEVSTVTCNDDMKGNAKICKKIIVLSHPFGDLRVIKRTGFIYGSMESALSTSY